MINVFDYEYKDVIVECTNGEVYEGHVDWCIRAVDSDENEDMLGVGSYLLLASEIKAIKTIDNLNSKKADKENKTA